MPLEIKTEAYGTLTLEENSIEEISAIDVLEHVPDLPAMMAICLKLLKDGGVFKILVPYDLSLGAWQDPTHIRAFNENSWLYFTEWSWYLGWLDYRFDLIERNLNPTELGKELVEKKVPAPEIARTPRAIESMSITLRKRAITPAERSLAKAYLPDW